MISPRLSLQYVVVTVLGIALAGWLLLLALVVVCDYQTVVHWQWLQSHQASPASVSWDQGLLLYQWAWAGQSTSVPGLTTAEAMHMQDVVGIFTIARTLMLWLLFIGCILYWQSALVRYLWRNIVRVAAGTLVVGGIVASIAFEWAFTALHQPFFARGTWIFSESSVLIQYFPESFFFGMTFVIWIVAIALACGSLITSRLLRRASVVLAMVLVIAGCSSVVTVETNEPVDVLPPGSVTATTTATPTTPKPQPITPSTTTKPLPTPTEPPATEPVRTTIPATFDMPVAFGSQAPFYNWDHLHQEACEEAAMVMAVRYFRKLPVTPQIMEDELQKLVAWQTAHGYGDSITAAEVQYIMKEYFGYNTRLQTDVTTDRFKKELSQGNLIIVPAAGRQLGNPNFTGLGPIYHMLVARGYDRDEFITNDPGTRKGEAYRYSYDTLINSVHDWVEGDINAGRKVVIIVEPE